VERREAHGFSVTAFRANRPAGAPDIQEDRTENGGRLTYDGPFRPDFRPQQRNGDRRPRPQMASAFPSGEKREGRRPRNFGGASSSFGRGNSNRSR
jgi:hypothetical protein